jgi:hypothetical protein
LLSHLPSVSQLLIYFQALKTVVMPIVVIAIAGLVGSIVYLKSAEATNATNITNLNTLIGNNAAQAAKDLALSNLHHDATMARLEKSLEKSIEKLQFGQRWNQEPENVPAYREDVGAISQVGKESITLEWIRGEVTDRRTFNIAPGARVLIDSNSAKLADLKPGMNVRLLHRHLEKVQLIETPPKADPQG